MNCGFGEKIRIAHRRSLFFCKSSEFLIFFFGNFVRHTFSSQELSVHSTFWKNLPDQNKRGIFLLFEKAQVNTKAEPLYSRHSISSTKTLHSLWLQRSDSPQDILCTSTQAWTKQGVQGKLHNHHNLVLPVFGGDVFLHFLNEKLSWFLLVYKAC